MDEDAPFEPIESPGRPTKFEPSFIRIAETMASHGALEGEIAKALGISQKTLWVWKCENDAFRNALKVGSEAQVERLSRSMYHAGVGYEHDDVDIRVVESRIVKTRIRKHYPPNPTAGIFMLCNLAPDRFKRNLPEASDGGGITVTIKHSRTPDEGD